ncbi:MAG: hypothetical protein M3162_06190 [Thermoproteota archaeon]|nr:hypothetical protein [Thermoproteota archaeon]
MRIGTKIENMSMPEDGGANFVMKILEEDGKLVEQMRQKKGQTEEQYKLLDRRLMLYEEALKMPMSDMHRLILDGSRSGVYSEMLVFQIRIEFEDQISKIVTRLDTIENDIKDLRKKLSNSST